jgi:hypothetical protein
MLIEQQVQHLKLIQSWQHSSNTGVLWVFVINVLHAVQDLWEGHSDEEEEEVLDTPPSDSVCLAISKAAMSSRSSPKTIQFSGSLQGCSITILLNSGSTSSFVSTKIAQQLSSAQLVPYSSTVSVAGGGLLSCSALLQDAEFIIDGTTFSAHFKVLPLVHFDMILGMDWLEQFNPMQVHWKSKWLQFMYKGDYITLQGLSPVSSYSV